MSLMRLVFVQRQACCKNREKGLGGREGGKWIVHLTNRRLLWLSSDTPSTLSKTL